MRPATGARVLGVASLLVAWAMTAEAATGDVVLYASEATVVKGNWTAAASGGAASGRSMGSQDNGWSSTASPQAAPANYFEMTFTAPANTSYRVWLRLRAANNSKWNDAVWVQFSDALVNGSAAYRIGTTSGLLVNLERCSGCGTSGWGWQNTAYWLTQATAVSFAASGTHTVRVQIREDGVEVDQIVLSPSTYYSAAPGPIVDDATIVPKTPPASSPYSGTPIALPGVVDAALFDHGGAGVAYSDTTAGNAGGAFRATDVDLEASAGGGYNVGWTAAGEWLVYTVNVTAAGVAATNAIEHAGAGAPFEVSGRLVNGDVLITVRDYGAWRAPRLGDQGRGLSLMRALMDAVEVTPTPEGTTVVLRRRVASHNGAAPG